MAAERILFVIMDLHGGAGVFCRILAKTLRKTFSGEFHLSLLVLRDRGFLPDDNQVFDHIEIIGERGRLLQIVGLSRSIKRADPDCIICVGTFANLLVPILARGRGRVLTVHGNYSQLLKEAKYAWILKPLLRWRFARSLIVAPARGVAEDLIGKFSARDVRVIYHGIDGGELLQASQRAGLNETNEPYILAVGRLAQQKDYPTMLRAYALARQRGLSVRLIIVGNGPEESALRTMARELDIAAHVKFMGHLDNPFPYMKNAEFLVLSSTWEGFGLVLIEAMSLGVPCVSTDCPSGPGEILGAGEYGMLVPVGDAERLAEAMVRMQEPEIRRRFSELARKRSDDFTLQRMAAAYREVLRECVIVS